MTGNAIDRHQAPGRAGLLDRLVVRADVIRHGFFLLFAIQATTVMVILSYPILAFTGSRTLAMMVIVLAAVPPALFVAAGIRAVYCFFRPCLTPRWLAAANAVFGDEIMTPVLARLRLSFSPDDVLRRADFTEAIWLQRLLQNQARRAAHGMRMRDVAGQGQGFNQTWAQAEMPLSVS
jgi:hypothetical protein